MKQVHTTMSTGLKGLDTILNDVLPGDNIVWQVDSIKDYVPFIEPFCTQSNKDNRKLIYFRFADHEPLIPEHIKIDTYELHPEEGFEKFLNVLFAGFPDFNVKVEDLIAEGDKVCVRGEFLGTHTGKYYDPSIDRELDPTGKRIFIPFCIIYRLSNGKAVERGTVENLLDFCKQLDIVEFK